MECYGGLLNAPGDLGMLSSGHEFVLTGTVRLDFG